MACAARIRHDGRMHAFVDESERSVYLLAAVMVRPAELGVTRARLRTLRRPGQRRIHMGKEGASRRREVLSAVVAIGVPCRIYLGKGHPVAARPALLGQLVEDMLLEGATLLVLESAPDSGQDDRDRGAVRLALAGRRSWLTYEHRRAYEEPLLWLPDIVAWAYGAGGDWRRRVEPILEKVIDLGQVP